MFIMEKIITSRKKEQEPEKTEANAETPTTTNTEEPQKPDEQQTE